MCSVQVVLFAEVMGRSTGRPRGVCRRLFTDAPSEKSAAASADPGQFLRAMEVELRRRDTDRWNFDFQKERPLPGRYQWVAVGARKEENVIDTSTEVKVEATEVEIVDEVVRPKKVSSSIPECKRRKSSGSGAGAVATQAKITDFLRKRKRLEPEESKKLKMRRLSSNMASTAAGPT